jgi:hypothetical protein
VTPLAGHQPEPNAEEDLHGGARVVVLRLVHDRVLQHRRPYNSVKTAGSGVKIDITGVSPDRGSYQVHVYR